MPMCSRVDTVGLDGVLKGVIWLGTGVLGPGL